MDKLELKYLAPYLSYGLKVTFSGDENTHEIVGLDITDAGVQVLSPFGDSGRAKVEDCKPILRPLSDLEDNNPDCWIEKLSEDTEHSLSYSNGMFSDATGDIFNINWLPNICFSWLVQHHFDVFGLIPSGLAISYKDAGL